MVDPIAIVLLLVLIALGIVLAIGPEKYRKALLAAMAFVLGGLGLRFLDKLIIRGGVFHPPPVPKPDKKEEIESAKEEEVAVDAAKAEAEKAAPKRNIAPDLEKLAAKANRRRKERKP
jgi:hypothetical protein